MKKINFILAAATLVLSTNANSALVSRLGGLAYYDTEADLSWLANANAAVGSEFDTANPSTGQMDWETSKSWVASLDVLGVTGWRLPNSLVLDPSCGGAFTFNCTGGELGNLFYNVLGNTASTPPRDTAANTGPFDNVQPTLYWTATESLFFTPPADGQDLIFVFNMELGFKEAEFREADLWYAWAVKSGDVGEVPVPAAVWLFGSGLIGLTGFARRKTQNN